MIFLVAVSFCLIDQAEILHTTSTYGALAQLGERIAGSDEVRGSIPLGSTIIYLTYSLYRLFFIVLENV